MIISGDSKIAVIGLGYVGLPLAVEFAKNGMKVLGIDTDKKKTDMINRGKSYITDVPTRELKSVVEKKNFSATTDFSKLKKSDVIIICVPTPLGKSKEPDVSYIVSATQEIKKHLRKDQLVILESTTYPGTTRELVLPMFEQTGLKCGKDFYLAFSPERVDPANKIYKIHNTPKIVGGITKKCTDLAYDVYSRITGKVVKVSSSESAEMVKLLENTFRAVNIALVNEVALMCERLKINVWEVIDAASTKPFGFMPFYPGPGIGGHCIPLDPHYLSWKLKTLNFFSRFIELAGDINSNMPEHVVERVSVMLNENSKPLKSSKILVLGVAYKANVSDWRESPAIDIIKILKERKAKVDYHDPYVPLIDHEDLKIKSVNVKPASFKKYDCVIIVTNHACFNIPAIVRSSRLVFDARNATKGINDKKITRL